MKTKKAMKTEGDTLHFETDDETDELLHELHEYNPELAAMVMTGMINDLIDLEPMGGVQ
jgi:hypothetical protein